MKLHFFGAAQEVTGTCYLLESGSHKILVDCGIFQGGDGDSKRNQLPFPFEPDAIDAVFLTHPHMDHVGRVPLLVKRGYRGPIFATFPTADLSKLLWKDMLSVMQDAEKREQVPPLYDEEDVAKAEARLMPVEYETLAEICAGAIKATFHDAGHVLGSAFIEFNVENRTIVFSGDLGNDDVPILRPTASLPECDVLVIESTYGDRLHEDLQTRRTILRDLVKETIEKKGVLMIPTFAIERTQEIMLTLHHLAEEGEIPRVPVFLDSPLAINATHVYEEYGRYFNDNAKNEMLSGHELFELPGFVATKTPDMSKKINDVVAPKIILAGSGMMTGGRILHHLVRYLPDPNSTLMIVGYQAHGTVGRKLYEGAKTVRIHGHDVHVNATVTSVGAWSAHADQAKLLRWIQSAPKKPEVVLVTHGEQNASETLERKLKRDLNIDAYVPAPGQMFNLHT
jgi:metallo-beta-lactamase family protein